jgi:hypothetical protein
MKRAFIQTPQFSALLKDYQSSEELLIDIEQGILKDLTLKVSKRDFIQGTGGFTKLRVPNRAEKRGKRSSIRVIYFDCEGVKRTFLILLYSKSGMENISEAGKKQLKQMAKELKSWVPKKSR